MKFEDEDKILGRINCYIGRRCPDIDSELTGKYGYGSTINPLVKSYCSTLSKRMLGYGTIHEIKLESMDMSMKNITLKPDGTPKEHMSFRTFNGNELMKQEWENSIQYNEFKRKSLVLVYQYTSRPIPYKQENIIFKGAFFWTLDDEAMSDVKAVWEDTKTKILEKRMGEFIRAKDDHIAFVKPHGADSRDVYICNGETVKKESFWLKSSYIGKVVKENLPGSSELEDNA